MKQTKAQKQAQEAESIHERVIQTSSGHYGYWSTNVETGVAKCLLLQGSFFRDGERWKYKAKSMGCGVQEVSIVRA